MKTFMTLLLICSLLVLSGCETVRGFGKDVQKAGQWMQDKTE